MIEKEKRGTKQRRMRVLYMALGNFNVSLLFWLFIIFIFLKFLFHISEKCLILSYPILMKFYFNFIKNVVL